MGGLSASKSSADQSSSQQQVGASDSSTAIGLYDGSTLNMLDGGAILGMKDVALAVIEGAGAVNQNMGDLVGQQADANADNASANSALLEQALRGQQSVVGALQDLGKTTATAGQTDFQKTLMYLGLGLMALVGLMFFFNRR
jgi:hypothetical protein